MTKLTEKQRKFVQFYDGNATQTAIKAGYSKKSARLAGSGNMTKSYILDAIKLRSAVEDKPKIANRQDRQKFWTDVMNDVEESMANRLRAAELLGKSEADFIDRHEHTVKEYLHEDLKDLTADELRKESERLADEIIADRNKRTLNSKN